MWDGNRMSVNYSDSFWKKIASLEFLSADDVQSIINENLNRKVPFPESLLLREILERETAEKKLNESEKSELEKRHLLIERYEQGDFFIADIGDLPYFRDDIASMGVPLFALKPKDIRNFEFEINGTKTSIKPTSMGRATIFDKDVWIFAISKLMQSKFLKGNKGLSNAVEFSVQEFFNATNRGHGGKQFEIFRDSLERLSGTRITTEIETGGQRTATGFGLLDSWEVTEESKGRLPLRVIVELPQWVYRSVLEDEVLNISKDYFRLKKPIDRRIYEIARKFCGKKPSWKISLEKLYEKTGATMTIREFRRSLNSLITAEALPDYSINYDRAMDMVQFINRDETVQQKVSKKEVDKIIQGIIKKVK